MHLWCHVSLWWCQMTMLTSLPQHNLNCSHYYSYGDSYFRVDTGIIWQTPPWWMLLCTEHKPFSKNLHPLYPEIQKLDGVNKPHVRTPMSRGALTTWWSQVFVIGYVLVSNFLRLLHFCAERGFMGVVTVKWLSNWVVFFKVYKQQCNALAVTNVLLHPREFANVKFMPL